MTQDQISQGNLEQVNGFLATLESRDLATIRDFLAEDVDLVQPLTFSGSADPDQMFRPQGKLAVMAYFESVVSNFSQVRFIDRKLNLTVGGKVIFVEARGDLITSKNQQPYHNIYLFKFELNEQGRLWHISEYANPVTAGQALGIPLGQG